MIAAEARDVLIVNDEAINPFHLFTPPPHDPMRLYDGPTDTLGIFDLDNPEIPIVSPLMESPIDGSLISTSTALGDLAVIEHPPLPKAPSWTTFGESSTTLPQSYRPESATHTGFYGMQFVGEGMSSVEDRSDEAFVQAVRELHYRVRDPQTYHEEYVRLAQYFGKPVPLGDSTESEPRHDDYGSLAAGALPILSVIQSNRPPFVRKAMNALIVASMFLSACLPENQPMTELPPTATMRPAVTEPYILPTSPPTPEPILGLGILSPQEIIESLPGLPTGALDAGEATSVRLTETLKDALVGQGLAPVYSETDKGEIVADVYRVDGTTVFAVPYPYQLFDVGESTFGPNGELLIPGSDTVSSTQGNVVYYGDSGLDASMGTEDDTVDTKLLTVVGVQGLPENHTVSLVIVSTLDNPAGPQGQLRFAVTDEQGKVVGSMPAAFAGDKNVRVDWSDNTVTTTVDSLPVSFTFVPSYQPATETPAPEITATQVIAPTVEATDIAPIHIEVDLDTVEVIPRWGAATYGLEAKYRDIDLSYEHFITLNQEAGFDTATYPYSYKGPSAERELPYITAVFIDAYRKVSPGGNSAAVYKIGVFGPEGLIVVESVLTSVYNSLESYPDILSHPVACVRWNSSVPVEDQSPQLVENTTQFCDINALLNNTIALRGQLMMISVAKLPNSEENATKNAIRYFTGEPSILSPPPFTTASSNGFQGGGYAFFVPTDTFEALLYKP